MDNRDNPFLQGNLAPIHDEIQADALKVSGALPRGLNGTFYRNGPNPQFDPPGHYHLFDGDGMVHSVQLDEGRATYRNRWVLTKGLAYEREKGEAVFMGMNDFSIPSPEAMRRVGNAKQPANTSVLAHAGKVFALAEGGSPYEIDPVTLETVGTYRFPDEDGKKVKGAFTAHPRVCGETGELFAFGYSPVPPYLRYFVIDENGELDIQEEIDIPRSVMMHDFAITQKYAVFLDAPAVFDIQAAFRNEPVLSWEPDKGTRFGVMPRYGSGREIRWFELDPCYIFHFYNAYDEGDEVVLDAARLPALAPELDRALDAARVCRFRINLITGKVSSEQLCEEGMEFPQVDPRRSGQKHRYGYSIQYPGNNEGPGFYPGGMRFDFETGKADVHCFGPHHSSGELVYAANPESDREEDGWLLSFVHDKKEDSSELVVLNAGDVQSGPIARIAIPRRVPEGFHSHWRSH